MNHLRRHAALVLAVCFAGPAVHAAEVTWADTLAPIVHQHCVACHRPGAAAPFSLLRYEDSAKRAGMLAEAVASGYMPPWKPAAGWGDFHGTRGLTPAERAAFAQWADAGAPAGELPRAPLPPSFPADGWQLGPPDLVLRLPEPFRLPADGPDIYRVFVLPFRSDDVPAAARRASGLPGVVGLRAVEIRPGNRRAVHHALGYMDSSGEARRRDAADPGPGYVSFGTPGFKPTGYLGSYVPGYEARALPAGIDEALPLDGTAVVQIHYSPTGREEIDQTEIGLYFSREPIVRAVVWWTISETSIDIPPGAPAHRLKSSRVLPADALVFSILPHLHYLGRTVRATATRPDGTGERLLRIDDWDFNWQNKYDYRTPLRLPAGTRIDVEWTFDNSAANPRNPHQPPRRVVHGPNSTDEMAELHLNLVPVDPADYPRFGDTIRGVERTPIPAAGAPAPELAARQVVVEARPQRPVPGLDLNLVSVPVVRLDGLPAAAEWWVARHETTQADYTALMGTNPSRFADPARPVENVSWHDANEFCRRLTERERAAGRLEPGLVFRLPTEAEWEFACRAGTTGDYAGTGVLDDMGWHAGNSSRTTQPVGLKQPNAWGLHDFHGNVWEWCADELGSQRTFRGGSAVGLASSCRSWSRSANAPESRHPSLGFRVVLAPPRE